MRCDKRNFWVATIGIVAAWAIVLAAWAIRTEEVNLGPGTYGQVIIARDGDDMQFFDQTVGTTTTLNAIITGPLWEVSSGEAQLKTVKDIDMQSTATVKNLPTPTASTDAANKAYVDANINLGGASDAIDDSDGDTTVTTEEASGSDVIRFYLGGTERLRMHSNGWLGLGATTSTVELEISDGAGAAGTPEISLNSGQAGVAFNASALVLKGGTSKGVVIQTNGSTERVSVASGGNVVVNDSGAAIDVRVEGGTAANLLMVQGSTDRVGINDATPDATLDVGGALRVDSGAVINATSGNYDLQYNGDTRDNVLFGDASAGFVGIGTNAPSNLLSLLGADATPCVFKMQSHHNFAYATGTDSNTFNLQASRGTAASPTVIEDGDPLITLAARAYDGTVYRFAALIRAHVDGTPGSGDMPGRLEFHTTADGASTCTERMVIKADGSTGIGESAPGYRLELKTTVGGGYFGVTTSSNGDIFEIDANGDVGIGDNTPTSRMDVFDNAANYVATFINDGDAINRKVLKLQGGTDDQSTATCDYINFFDGDGGDEGAVEVVNGTLQIRQGCDLRNKDADSLTTSPLKAVDGVRALRVAHFGFKTDAGGVGTMQDGFIAQEVAAVFPEAAVVKFNPDTARDEYSIYPLRFLPIIWRALQEQQAQIDAQEARILRLEKLAGL